MMCVLPDVGQHILTVRACRLMTVAAGAHGCLPRCSGCSEVFSANPSWAVGGLGDKQKAFRDGLHVRRVLVVRQNTREYPMNEALTWGC